MRGQQLKPLRGQYGPVPRCPTEGWHWTGPHHATRGQRIWQTIFSCQPHSHSTALLFQLKTDPNKTSNNLSSLHPSAPRLRPPTCPVVKYDGVLLLCVPSLGVLFLGKRDLFRARGPRQDRSPKWLLPFWCMPSGLRERCPLQFCFLVYNQTLVYPFKCSQTIQNKALIQVLANGLHSI